MDETAIWYNMPGATTIAVKGTHCSAVDDGLTMGHEKQHMTVCLAAMAKGSNKFAVVVT